MGIASRQKTHTFSFSLKALQTSELEDKPLTREIYNGKAELKVLHSSPAGGYYHLQMKSSMKTVKRRHSKLHSRCTCNYTRLSFLTKATHGKNSLACKDHY